MRLSQLIYRYLVKTFKAVCGNIKKVSTDVATPLAKESPKSLMKLSEEFEDLNPDKKTRLLIELITDVHDCANIMQFRSLRY